MYVNGGFRDAYRAVGERVRADCDLVLDGTRDPDALAEQLAEAIARRATELT
jgi:hypothetical protein